MTRGRVSRYISQLSLSVTGHCWCWSLVTCLFCAAKRRVTSSYVSTSILQRCSLSKINRVQTITSNEKRNFFLIKHFVQLSVFSMINSSLESSPNFDHKTTIDDVNRMSDFDALRLTCPTPLPMILICRLYPI